MKKSLLSIALTSLLATSAVVQLRRQLLKAYQLMSLQHQITYGVVLSKQVVRLRYLVALIMLLTLAFTLVLGRQTHLGAT